MRYLISTTILAFALSSSAYAADTKDFSKSDAKLIGKYIQEYFDARAPEALDVSSFLSQETSFTALQKADNANGAGKLLFARDFSGTENARPAAGEWNAVADNANGAGTLLVPVNALNGLPPMNFGAQQFSYGNGFETLYAQ